MDAITCSVGNFGSGVYHRGLYPMAAAFHLRRLTRSTWNPRAMPSPHPLDPLVRLMQTLQKRADERPAGSYTTRLLDGGTAKIGKKIREEAEELIEAADESGESGREHFVYEAGDLLYHTLVLLAWRGVDVIEVAEELARREGTSGLVEKANRKPHPDNGNDSSR